MSWIYNKKEVKSIEDLPEETIGFVYIITNLDTGKYYLGKKVLSFSRRSKIGNREKISTKTRKSFKTTVKESDWLSYWGSSLLLKQDIALYGKDRFKREILETVKTKRYLSYLELEYQVKYEVLKKDTYNKNILGKFYQKDMEL